MKVKSVKEFRYAWVRRNIFFTLGFAVLTSLAVIILVIAYDLHLAWLAVMLPTYLVNYLIYLTSKPSKEGVHSYLHKRHPEFEHSLRQLEKDDGAQVLEILQRDKIQKKFENTELSIPKANRIIAGNSLVGIITILLPLASLLINPGTSSTLSASDFEKEIGDLPSSELRDSAYIDQMLVTVSPPRYTRIRQSKTQELDLEVPEGSDLRWSYVEHGPTNGIDFRIGEEQESLSAKNGSARFNAMKSFLYYYTVNNLEEDKVNSPYYSVKVKEDEQPQAILSGIDEYQKLPWKENYDISFNIDLNDDYGLEDAFVSATVATGSGESVLFREKKFDLRNFKANRTNYSNTFEFSTQDFDMEPGSELYFYVMAKDNCPFRIQAVKTTTFFVVLEDTTSYDYIDDAGMQVDLMPDFFRSQRQIIIDTEKLLEEKGRISKEEFKERSNELGFDQKMLRLKYGQFLGEEAESGIALENEVELEDTDHDHDGEHDHGDEGMEDILNEYGHNHDHEAEEGELLATNGTEKEDPKNPSWVEELSHSHDNAEENTYFEVSLKTKLKAALSVMWDSELHLRLYDPETSLPYQYQALSFLEEIKNHARVYVHRIGFDPPAIKVAEKRLSGEQDKIVSSQVELARAEAFDRAQTEAAIDYFSVIEKGPQLLLTKKEKALLEAAGLELAQVAIEHPSLLEALTELRTILNKEGPVSASKVLRLRQAMIKSMPKLSEEIQNETQVFHHLNSKAIEALRESR